MKSNISPAKFSCSPAEESSLHARRPVDTRDRVDCLSAGPGDYILISLPIAAGTGCLSVKCLRLSELNQKRRRTREEGETRFGATNFIASVFRRADEDSACRRFLSTSRLPCISE